MPKQRNPAYYAKYYALTLLLEVVSFKPFNVNRYYDLSNDRLEEFVITALSTYEPSLRVAKDAFRSLRKSLKPRLGRYIYSIIKSFRELCPKCGNTYLGSVLLMTPIEVAAITSGSTDPKVIGKEVVKLLEESTLDDSIYFYRAVRSSRPGAWLRKYEPKGNEPPDVFDPKYVSKLRGLGYNLYDVLKYSARHDLVSAELVNGLKLINELAYPYLVGAVNELRDLALAITETFMYLLSRVNDTLIARKGGLDLAKYVSNVAKEFIDTGGLRSSKGLSIIKKVIKEVVKYGSLINAGSVADVVNGALYIYLLNTGYVVIDKGLSNYWLRVLVCGFCPS
ncbi:MAG TPA: hypothetical protein ENF75_01365 [Acidilobales archaeon]|nr:hypothetical protein [Acidilobales archaeon]